MPKAE
ncbi:conserved hypothetical protein, partial [Trichinella spiralis]